MSESRRNFLTVLNNGLGESDLDPVREYIFDPEKEEDVAACAFEALQPIHKALVSESEDSVKSTYMNWLTHLVTIGTPKEILLGLLEIVEQDGLLVNSVSYIVPLLQITLLRLPAKRVSSLVWTLSTLDKYIQQIQLPKDHEYEKDERKFLDLDPDVIAITTVLDPYVALLQAFIPEVSVTSIIPRKHKYDERTTQQQNVLIRFILSLFGRPLAYMDLGADTSKSKPRLLSEDCMHGLYLLKGYLFKLYETATSIEATNKHFNADMALAIIAYLAIGENVTALCPSVYDPWFLFESHIKCVNLLLSETTSLLVLKGLHLNTALINKMSPDTLTFMCLDLPGFSTLFGRLFNVMVHCPVKELRTLALNNFQDLVRKFSADGCSKLLVTLLQGHTDKPMVQSLLLNTYKDNLHILLQSSQPQTLNPFLKPNLDIVLKIAVRLQVETDLIENSSRLLSALNLLRYVALKEKECPLGARDFLKTLQSRFLEPLRTALNLSRAHYKKRQEECKYSKKAAGGGVVESVRVNRETLPELPEDYEEQICSTALTTFDLIESVIVRLEENMAESKCAEESK